MACMLGLWIFSLADERIVPTIVIEGLACLWTWLTLRSANQVHSEKSYLNKAVV
jgi:hypothetical protein